MIGIIGKKIGMTSVYNDKGQLIPCTIIEAGPCIVTQIRSLEKDGYKAIQIAFGEKKERVTTNALIGHFKKADTTPKKVISEFRLDLESTLDTEIKLGQEICVDIFKENQFVDVSGISKGKGFQGVVKRHNFGGVMQASHGQHNRLRAPGSIGAGSDPSRVFKGMKMAGRMGGDKVTVQNLAILRVDVEKNLLLIKGAIPGHNNSIVIINK